MRPRTAILPLGGLVMAAILIGLVVHQSNGHHSLSARPSASPSADTRAVTDSAPYWCDLVSQEALRRVTGVGTGLIETRDGRNPGQGGCTVADAEPASSLSIEFQQQESRTIIDRQLKQWQKFSPVRLPVELGYGFVVYAPGYVDAPPFVVSSVFACDRKEPSIYIEIAKFSEGRDYIADLTELMRIAEKRYGSLHKCVPGPLK